jgi:aminobenzoyl-glutamate transport protein
LGDFNSDNADKEWLSAPKLERLSSQEYRALGAALAATILFVIGLVYLCWPVGKDATGMVGWLSENGPWFGALGVTETGKKGPAFLDAVVAIIFVAFLIPGLAYGWVMGTMRNDKHIIQSMTKSMTSMGAYIVLVFFAAQFVKFFDWTNLGTILAVQGAQAIKQMNLDNAGVFVLFILVCAVVNLLMGSASAKWTFMAPIFVPMLMQIGYSPELIQCAYRIGDSCTNVISPMMSYFGMIFVFASRYDHKFGMGSIISLMFPYTVVFLVVWILFFYLWVFVLQLPLGPDAPTYFVQ